MVDVSLEFSMRSGSQFLEMFYIGQQQIFKFTEDEEESEVKYIGLVDFQVKEIFIGCLEGGQGLQFVFFVLFSGIVDFVFQVVVVVFVEFEIFFEKYFL